MWSRCPRLLALVTGFVLVIASCTSDDAEIEATAPSATTPPALKVVVTAEDFYFRVPPKVPAGLVEIEIENAGKEPHQAQVARLREGVTIQALSGAAAQNDPARLIEMVDVVGGPNSVGPGGNARVVNELTSGSYVLICFVFSQDGREHSAKGMLTPFEVTARRDAPPAPKVDTTIRMRDFTFDVPARVDGQSTVAVVNDGAQPHELALFKLQPGRTLDEARAFMFTLAGSPPPPGPRPVFEVGGIMGIGPRATGWMKLDLAPGEYVAVCFFPDPKMGNVPHIVEGMIKQFTIA